ncbi:hypothetical protein [Niveispirillum cyanobacteriorum]|uniref:Uncharacterized protein n=1 Tax=Niveispirillum cyanobacteriorum TaxID=1612173 RepID=A0A2K9N8R2_9PROT|nr:hypothetical protein [Niveispirillum cyanobacteriorum]AUN29474.1 hypothetical protein C0V82_03910 [Niveispirillum cyanobacteriorum]GGE87486.1 hypothetical protein GCM10011317_50610 [Niveispirillum cyanobacteriorum]
MTDSAIDKVRASRDGHQYHEAWLARRALALLLPRDELCGIAVEGLSVEDQMSASQATIEIADATFYYGSVPNFRDATRIEIAQFKYSIAKRTTNFLASDAAKTLEKFAKSEASFLSRPDRSNVAGKVSYTIYTNRPISPELICAVSSLAEGTVPSNKKIRAQYDDLLATIPLSGEQRKVFAAKLSLFGQGGDLRIVEKGNARIIADWSASSDAIARARLGELRQLVRNKAGYAGQHNNIITKIDVLAELGIAHERDLLPTPQAFAESGPVVEREQLHQFLDGLASSSLWIVHAAGGVGKTVFLQSAATRLAETDEVVIFDCFGGGAYRSPLDVRHRPQQGLMHIVNELACRGLCDPILPGATDPTEVVRLSLKRFSQSIEALRRIRAAARLIVIIDAADNAAMEAHDRGEVSFPKMLLESLSYPSLSVDGLVCIATARPERRALAIGRSQCKDFALSAFSISESQTFIKKRRPEATTSQIEAIHRRSNGNPRVMANLIEPDRSLAEVDTGAAAIDLNDLIRQRIEKAIRLADDKGSTRQEVAAFLCALSVLPPPVPVDEIAAAFGIAGSEVESFAADLSPLLERTRHGLIFRDEPTETLVRQSYGQQLSLLEDVATRLTSSQGSSVYAARSLPALLFAMGRTDQLRALAFDTRFPAELDSDLAKRAIRLNRLRTAVGAAAKDKDFSATVDLLVELAALVIVDERGEDYLLEQPDLVVGLGDPEALRRLFEARTGWPGTRHARLATAYIADGDAPEAYGHAVRADDWHRWLQQQDEETRRTGGPEYSDFASIAFYLFAKGKAQELARYISRWKPFYGFLIANRLFEHCAATEAFGNLPDLAKTLVRVVSLAQVPPALIVASFANFPSFASRPQARSLMKKVAAKLGTAKDLPEEFSSRQHDDTYRKALMRCAIRMANLGMARELNGTLLVAATERYRIWLLREAWHVEQLVPFALGLAARCVTETRVADFFDCLPQELWVLVEDAPRPSTDKAQRELLDQRLKELETTKDNTTAEIEERRKKSTLSSSERYYVSERISRGIVPLLALVRQLTTMIAAVKPGERKVASSAFLDAWRTQQTNTSERGLHVPRDQVRFANALYMRCALELFTALDLLTAVTAQKLADCLEACEILAPEIVIGFVKRLAEQRDCHSLAGSLAVLAVRLIEREDEVQYRSQLFARLSRALLPANRAEAASVFKRGLKELDAIGSGDYEFTYELLEFAATVRGAGLPPPLALRLAKICEINVYDSHRWHWPLTARAFSRVMGAAYLAQIARWHDRDKVDLSLTLPSALTHLLNDGALSPSSVVSLLWLVDPQPVWHWGWDDLVKALLKRGATDAILHEALNQYERSFPGRLSSHYLYELRRAFDSDPKIAARFVERLESFERRSTLPRKADTESRPSVPSHIGLDISRKKEEAARQVMLKEALAATDPADAASFERFVEKLEAVPGWQVNKSQVYKSLRDRVAYADRAKHLEAIVSARNLKISEKNDLMQAVKDEWTKDSPTQLASLTGFGLRLVREHAEDLLGKKWGFASDIHKLSEVTGTPIDELAIALVEAATTRELDAAAMTWLSTATILSKRADEAAPRNALARLLDSGAARLADDIGDGPWREELNAGTDPDQVAAGLLWFGLGSPVAKERWRAAHAVQAMARHGHWSVIARMFTLFGAADAGAFQDRSLPFFKLNAQLWFLLAIARIALDSPSEVLRFQSDLEAVAFDDTFPHVGLREAACGALRHCLVGRRDASAMKLRARIGKVNVSPFPRAKTRNKAVRDFPWERPKDVPESEPRFFFDYDFEKYQIDKLARVFGLPKWRINDLCHEWIRAWAPSVTSMNDFSGRNKPYSQRGYYRPTEEAYQSHGTYLAWHALALVGGRLLLERPVTDESYYDNPWQDWLSEYRITRKDGYWISDGTGRYPLVASNDLRTGVGDEAERDLPIADNTLLLSLAGIGLQLPEDIAVQARWNSPDGVECSIMSSLVDPKQAELTALAVATSPGSHMWLPFHEPHDEEDPRFRRDEMQPCEPWITHLQRSENLDERDPFGAPSALSIYRPAASVIAHFQLAATEPWSHAWQQKSGSTAFRYNAWGGWQGDGESAKRRTGHALYCDRAFLSKLLTDLDRDLIVLVKLERYQEKKRYSDEAGEEGKFTHSFTVAVLDKKLNVRAIEPTPAQADAVLKLSQYDVHNFARRLRAIKELSQDKKPTRNARSRGKKRQ